MISTAIIVNVFWMYEYYDNCYLTVTTYYRVHRNKLDLSYFILLKSVN